MKLTCSCGNIKVEWDIKLPSFIARQCACDYCVQQDCRYVSDAASTVSYKIFNESLVKIVEHGTQTAKFIECTNCGLALVTSEIDGVLYSILNAKVLKIAPYTLDPQVKVFSNELVTERLSRRKKNWCKTKICK